MSIHEVMRERMFGVEASSSRAADGLDPQLAFARKEMRFALARLAADAQAVVSEGSVAAEVRDAVLSVVEELADGAAADGARPTGRALLRVVLMGRTMAGKSTLFEALTGGDGSRRGDGRQRFTRSVDCRPMTGATEIVLIDTPGVGALDGAEDYATAFSEVPRADVVVWVAANDATTEDTAEALRHLTLLGKPVLLALNCRFGLGTPERVQRFLDDPGEAFEMSDGHIRRIESVLSALGGVRPSVHLIHAEAAYRAKRDPAAAALSRSSGIASLEHSLLDELTSRADQRRLLAAADAVRTQAERGHATLDRLRVEARALLTDHEEITTQLDSRWSRLLEQHYELGTERITAIVWEHRRWVDTVDVESDVSAAWQDEGTKLADELDTQLTSRAEELRSALEEAATDIAVEWGSFRDRIRPLEPLTGRSSIWWNRALKVGGRYGLAGGGAWIGAFVGAAAGPAGVAVGTIIGGTVGLLASVVDKIVDRFFRSRASVIRKRRRELDAQIVPLLQRAEDDALEALRAHLDAHRAALDGVTAARRADEAQAAQLVLNVDRTVERLAELLDRLDLATARALAELLGRFRMAESIQVAYRLPGRAMLVRVDERALNEAVLFPAAAAVEEIAALPADGPAHRAACYAALGLLGTAPKLRRVTPDHVDVATAEALPVGVQDVLSSLILTATGTQITFEGEPGHD